MYESYNKLCLLNNRMVNRTNQTKKVSNKDSASLVCIGIPTIIIFWPLYLAYKVCSKVGKEIECAMYEKS